MHADSQGVGEADDLWPLPVCGCLPVCLHSAAPQGAAGRAPPPHTAMLWFQGTHMPLLQTKQVCSLKPFITVITDLNWPSHPFTSFSSSPFCLQIHSPAPLIMFSNPGRPCRFFLSLVLLFSHPGKLHSIEHHHCENKEFVPPTVKQKTHSAKENNKQHCGSRLLQPAQVCDVLKGLILVLCFSMMHYVDYSMMYHLIRGQSVIKLYIIYNMLEVADRLFSSFGQDILDALYWTATEPKERKRDSIGVIPHFIMAVFYVFLHSILIMVQASTLNVAFNSHNKSLLTIMMSNNFVEIKGSVFKKFGKNNLFQMSNSDIKERFTSYVLLLIVCLRNMEQFLWKPDHLWVMFPDVFMVISSEIVVDIIKHAFITKFNDITADVYSEYRASLAFDLVSSRQKNACTDYSDSVARRMGFIPLPLAALLIRVVMSSVKVQGALSYTCVFLFYLGLVSLKVLNSIVLLGKSCIYVKRANMEDKLFERSSTTPSSSGKGSSEAEERCPPSSGKYKVEEIPVPYYSPPFSSSVTTQPTPRSDLFPPPPSDSSSATTACRPPTPPPEPEQTAASPSKEEEGDERIKGDSELKHRTPKKDLLEIDRFTICGNRID
ncbi:transmembrane anterior posterior transformation protein 1 homolog isoform X3 [Cheilinus undulatus]|uniref:transmembrane anterior posterior transformation protein 1 homolog isoform X3 n=1 Tax=Cheilinus undulatus TaxID=241271 RepID=UPI001BD213F8|nr:transmembrane anterior posterior transformation protein 1 homolog isoform X3 [Cheilinus undulatus]